MLLRTWRSLTLILAALGASAALPASIVLPVALAAIFAAAVLTWLVRKRRAFLATLLGTLGLAVATGLGLAGVGPWMPFVVWLVGFVLLVLSVVGETPGERRRQNLTPSPRGRSLGGSTVPIGATVGIEPNGATLRRSRDEHVSSA